MFFKSPRKRIKDNNNMTEITIIAIIALATLGAIAYIFGRNRRPDGTEEPIVIGEGDCTTCTPESPRCEQACMMEAATKPIEYFDDEELRARSKSSMPSSGVPPPTTPTTRWSSLPTSSTPCEKTRWPHGAAASFCEASTCPTSCATSSSCYATAKHKA